jgi:hypothetical protein
LRKRSSQPAPERGGKMNNNVNSERAHLGVFSTASYINIGDPYGTKPKERDPRLLGKQFSMAVPKQGIAGARPNNSMFDREHKWLYGGEKYVDKTMYIKTQPPEGRKKGFGSSDAHKRDQFSLDIEVRARRRAPAARFRCALPLGRPRRGTRICADRCAAVAAAVPRRRRSTARRSVQRWHSRKSSRRVPRRA